MPDDGDTGSFDVAGVVVTFHNEAGEELAKTELLTYVPSAELLGNMLVTQPEGPPETTATTATAAWVEVGDNGSVQSVEVFMIVSLN